MARKRKSFLEQFAYSAIQQIGTTRSLILHTVIFILIFACIPFFGIDRVMNIFTNALSLEAIYMAIFIQMSINRHGEKLKSVHDDIEDIAEDVEDLTEEDQLDKKHIA